MPVAVDHHTRLRDLITAKTYRHCDIEVDRQAREAADDIVQAMRDYVNRRGLSEDEILGPLETYEQIMAIGETMVELASKEAPT